MVTLLLVSGVVKVVERGMSFEKGLIGYSHR